MIQEFTRLSYCENWGKKVMDSVPESRLFVRIIIVVVVMMSSAISYKVTWSIWTGNDLSLIEGMVMGGMSLIGIVGIIYVLIQRIQMRKSETFRREKW